MNGYVVWVIAVAVAVIAATVLIVRFFIKNFGDDLTALKEAAWGVWCILILIRWQIAAQLRHKYVRSALGVALIGSFWVLLHAAVTVWGQLVSHPEHNAGPVTEAQSWLPLNIFGAAPAPPLWAEIVLVVLSFIIVLHQLHEWKLREREMAVPTEAGKLISQARSYMANAGSLSPADQAAFFEKAMTVVTAMLTIGRKGAIAASLMAPGKAGDPASSLKVAQVYPVSNMTIDRKLELPAGVGAAGKAFNVGVVYVPSVRHLGGIDATSRKSVGLVYRPGAKEDKKKESMICAQVSTAGAVKAVLCVSIDRRDAFEPLDIDIVKLGAMLLNEVDWKP